VRNSGANAVIEGVGDHGCEYMTGGRVVILGPTGRNFAAGMSGGIAYVFDPDDELCSNCNLEMVELDQVVDPDDIAELSRLIKNHCDYTGSAVAARILDDWEASLPKFTKVMPIDYKRALEMLGAAEARARTAPNESEPASANGDGTPAVKDETGEPVASPAAPT
jgi:glutamate synthase domain-containing protein 3